VGRRPFWVRSAPPEKPRYRELGDDFATLLQCVQHGSHVEFAVQGGLDADLDIVKIDEDGDLQFLFHFEILKLGSRWGAGGPSGPGPPRRKSRGTATGQRARWRR